MDGAISGVELSPGGWVEAFDAGGDDGASVRVVGFTGEAEGRPVIEIARLASGGGVGSELWVADADGGDATRLTVEPGAAIAAVEPDPRGRWVAYATVPLDAGAGSPRVLIADLRGGRTLIAAEAATPGWSPDGRTLRFLRRDADAWRPMRAHLLGGIAPLGPAALDVTPDRPGPPARFSPNGREVAGSRRGRLVTVALDGSGAVRTRPAAANWFDEVAYSGDSRWLYLGRRLAGGVLCPVPHLLLRIDDDRKVDVQRRLRLAGLSTAQARPVAAAWLPGDLPRLLVLATDRRWRVLDPDASELRELPLPLAAPFEAHGRLLVSPDGRLAALGATLYRIDPAEFER